MKVRFHADAAFEFEQAALYYESRRPGLGRALVSEVEAVCRRIEAYPSLGKPYKQTGFRHLALRRFPFTVFYVAGEDRVWIVAIAHTKRRPDYWKRRRAG